MPVFNKKGLLKLGRRKLHLWEGREGDGSVVSCTPYKDKQAVPSNMDLLEKRISEYDQKEMPSIKWLDKLTIKRVEKMQVQEQQRQQQQYSAYNNHFSNAPSHHKKNASFHSFNGAHIHQFNPLNYNHMNNPSFLNQHTQYSPSPSLAQQQQRMSLVIDLPPFKHPIVYHQRTCNPLLPEILPGKERDRVFVLHDPELNRDNPVEMKCHKLINARSSKGCVWMDGWMFIYVCTCFSSSLKLHCDVVWVLY